MYSNTAAVFRHDLAGALVEEAAGWELGTIGAKAAPVVNVDRSTGLYPKFKLAAGNLLRNEVKARAPYGSFARGTQAFDQDTYTCVEYGYEQAIDDKIVAEMMPFFDAEQLAGKNSLRKLILAHEIRVAAMTFNTTNYGSATNSATAYTVANLATFDVGLDVDAAKDRLRSKGENVNNLSVILSAEVFTRLRASTKLQNRLRGIGISSDTILNVDLQAVADALGVKEVLVGGAYYDAAAEGASYSGSAIWSNTYVWVGNLMGGGNVSSLFNGGAQYTLNWSSYAPVFGIQTYRDEVHKSDIVRSFHSTAEKVVNGNAGTLIATQYS